MARVKGLGLIVQQPSMPAMAVTIGVPMAALGSLAVYHTFGSMHAVKSGWAKLGLFMGGLFSLAVTFDGFVLAISGVKEELAPATPSDSTLVKTSSNVAGIRGLGRFAAQPALMVGQDHWLDRDYPDRYSEWWVGHHARR